MNNVLHESMTLFLWKYRIGLVNVGRRLFEEINLISGSNTWTGVHLEKKKDTRQRKEHWQRNEVTQGQKVCGERWEEPSVDGGIWHRKGGAESDTGASCSLNYHLGTNCQKETYWRKISTIMKKLEIAHESEHKTLWITWKIKHLKIYWY